MDEPLDVTVQMEIIKFREEIALDKVVSRFSQRVGLVRGFRQAI